MIIHSLLLFLPVCMMSLCLQATASQTPNGSDALYARTTSQYGNLLRAQGPSAMLTELEQQVRYPIMEPYRDTVFWFRMSIKQQTANNNKEITNE